MALQQGTIDAQENPFEVIYANRLYEQQDYVILTNHLPASHNLLISQVVYNGLSDTDKELIMAVGKAAIQYSREQCDARLSERDVYKRQAHSPRAASFCFSIYAGHRAPVLWERFRREARPPGP